MKRVIHEGNDDGEESGIALLPLNRNGEASAESQAQPGQERATASTPTTTQPHLTSMKKVATILIQVSQGMLVVMPLVILVYMIRGFGIVDEDNEKAIGQLTGFCSGLLNIGQALTSFLWGMAADRVGRKKVIYIGLSATALSTLMLGLSVNYTMACLARLLGGLLNGTIGTLKTIVGEAVRPSEKGQAFSYVSAGWGVGSILGSAIGGTLSEPCGVLFSGDALCGEDRGVFTLFPYLLPCLIAVALTCISFVTFALSFGETLKWPGGLFGQPYSRLSTSSSLASVAADQRESRDEGEFDDKAGDERWYKDRNTVLCLSGYVAIALAHIVHDEVLPLFASASREKGGLELSSASLSIPLAVGGALLLLFVLNIFPWLNRRLGPLFLVRAGNVAFIIPLLLVPTVYYANEQVAMLCGSQALKNVIGSATFTPSMILIQTVSPPSALGRVNGVGQTLAAVVRGAGPYLAGLFWGISTEMEVTGQQYLAFALDAMITLSIPLLYARVEIPSSEQGVGFGRG